jgi:hypothetical protein
VPRKGGLRTIPNPAPSNMLSGLKAKNLAAGWHDSARYFFSTLPANARSG